MCATGPDGYFVLNAGCIDGLDIHTLTIEKGDCLHSVLAGDVPPLAEVSMDPATKARIEDLILARARARDARDWAKADAATDALADLNVEVMDGPNGPQITILAG
jgi:cysteinyl-tRNA synthetase